MPHDFPLLGDLLKVLLASVPIAYIFNRLRLPVIIGFMVTGVLIGPFGLRLIRELEAIEALAEIGVVLLLFTIGLEFSLRNLMQMKRLVFGAGSLQVAFTTLLTSVIIYALGQPLNEAVFFGFMLSLSSTAIVLKSYIDRAEIDTPHGRSGVGILLFQDLCIVPMMLLVPILSGKEGSSPLNILVTLGTAGAVIAGIIFAARIVVPRALHQIVRLRSPEVFIIFIVLVSLGTAWVTSHFGLSLALGAFIAGLVLSESEYSHQIVADVLPFHDVFNSLFFVSIGMLLSVSFLTSNLLTVLIWVAALIAGKTLVTAAVVRVTGQSLRVSMMAGVGIAQVGEFSFILARMGLDQALMTQGDYQTFLAASVLSMIATPFLIKAAPRIGYAVQSMFSAGSPLEMGMSSFGHTDNLKGHVVIIGYGLNGRNVAKVLQRVNIPYIVLELNGEAVRKERAAGEKIEYGDSTRKEVLHSVGLERARVLVIAISDPIATRRTVALAREMNTDIHIIVRTRYMSELTDLYRLGANQVIPEEFETSIEIFSRVLREYGIARNIIQRQVDGIRHEGYEVLRLPTQPHIEVSELAEALGTASTETLFIEPSSPAVGRTLSDLDLRKKTGATVIAAIRDGDSQINPGPDYRFESEDIIVLMGSPHEIETAIELISAPNVTSASQ